MSRPVRSSLLILSGALSLPLFGALPELSSIEPIEFDEASGRMVASGDARLAVDRTLLRADRIAYYPDYRLADATGEVSVTSGQYHVSGESLSYDLAGKVFAIDGFRTGVWPYYIRGDSAGGSAAAVEGRGGTLYYGDPGPFTLNLRADRIRYERDAYAEIENATLRIGRIPVFYVPALRAPLDLTLPIIRLDGGISGSRGAFLQSETLFPLSENLRLGANLDGYTERGVLAGPNAQYRYDSIDQVMRGALSTGYLRDQGDTGLDSLGRPIDDERYFLEWRHKQHIAERVTLTGATSVWSDSEVTRDFRRDYFDGNQRPDNFLEGSFRGNNWVVSAFGRVRPNDFQTVVRREPELRLDLMPVPVFGTGAYQRLSASVVRLEESYADDPTRTPAALAASESDRLDAVYRIERPLPVTHWMTLTPLAGGRVTHYANGSVDPAVDPGFAGGDYTRGLYELGFDLEMRAHAVYPTVNRLWAIDGLKHEVRPVLNYRYFSDPEDDGEFVRVDRSTFDLNRSLLDLSDLRDVDSLGETHLARLGLENLYQTRAGDYGSRILAELNFYQDILFEKAQRYDGSDEETFNASWIEFVLNPAPWLAFDIATRFRTESLTFEQLRSRLSLKSGEIWRIGLSTDALSDQFDQYRLDASLRLSERRSLVYEIGYDADTGTIYEQRFGISANLHRNWDILYVLTFRDGDAREDEVSFDVRLRLVEP